MKTIRIKTLLLHEEKTSRKKTMTVKRFNKIPQSPEEAIERAMASRVPYLAMEMDTNIVELKVNNEVYEALFYIFQLHGILLKPTEDGFEIDLRERETYEPSYE